MCKVSVIVPLYNGEKTIGRCLKSLVRQTLGDIEIIVVDDGSKDEGPKVVRQFMERDPRIRLFEQENSGAGTARNRGIREAAGEFVGFVDCDDFVDRRMFEVMAGVLEKEQVPMAICQEKNVYIEGGKLHLISETKYPAAKARVYASRQVLSWFLNFSYLSLNSMCYKVVKRSVFEEYKIMEPENFRYAEDMVTSAALFSCLDKIAVVPEGFYYYVHRKESTSCHYSLRHAADIYYDWKEIRHYLEKCSYTGTLSNFFLGMTFSSLKQLYWADDQKERSCARARKLRALWKEERRQNAFKPVFRGLDIPPAHKLKICTAYFHLERVMCFAIKKLSWIPFFNFMA